MLTNSRTYNLDDDLDFFHNYYEKLVLGEIYTQSERAQNGDRDFTADATCVALNHLPPRYIRHNVDMTFFMSPQEMMEIEKKVSDAVKLALAYVESRERGADQELPAPTTDSAAKEKKTPAQKPKK